MKVCAFCGSSVGHRPDYAEAVQSLGKVLAAKNFELVYGGGKVGLMGILADAVLAAGGEVTGVIPRNLKEREIAHPALTTLHVVETMHERKAKMAELSSAFVALPGGAGTLEELFEVWTWAQLGLHNKPCGFLNVAGYYNKLFEFIDHMVAEQFLREDYRHMIIVEETPELLLKRFIQYTPPQEKWATTAISDNFDRSFSSPIVDVLAWICLKDRRVLCAQTKGKDVFYMPGGKREQGESDLEALRREIQEELNVNLIAETLAEVTVIEEVAHGYAEPTQVRMTCFQADYVGEIVPNSEIEVIAWLNYADLAQCAPAAQRVLEYLYQCQLID